jgi:hypothetical protein
MRNVPEKTGDGKQKDNATNKEPERSKIPKSAMKNPVEK